MGDSNHGLMCCIDFAADVFHICFHSEVMIKCEAQVLTFFSFCLPEGQEKSERLFAQT